MGSRIAVFNQGRIEQLGAPLDLYQRPASLFVATFLGAPRINLLQRPAAGAAEPGQRLWQQLVPAESSAQTVGLRAEHLRVVPAGQGVAAQVELAEHLGDSSILHLRVDGVPDLLRARAFAEQGVLPTAPTVGLQPDATQALAFDADGRRMP